MCMVDIVVIIIVIAARSKFQANDILCSLGKKSKIKIKSEKRNIEDYQASS